MIKKCWMLIVLTILISETGFTTEKANVDIKPYGKDKTLLSYNSNIACPVEIKILCERGEVIYSWQSASEVERIKKVFNLSELRDGSYNICVNYGENSVSHQIQITRDGIIIGPEIQLSNPYFCYTGEKLKLSFLNNAQKNVYLKVYNNNSELIDKIRLGKSINVQKIFSLSDLDKGEYDMVLTDFFNEHHFFVQK